MKLVAAAGGFAAMLCVLVFLVTHRASELGGGAEIMTLLAGIGLLERFDTMLDEWKARRS